MNKKGMTLLEMMVVVIIIAGMIMLAYPTYLSALEKGRALEAVRIISNIVGAQAKYVSENDGAYATSVRSLDVDISGTKRTENATTINDSGNLITTPNFTYTLSGAGISAAPKSTTYKYNIVALYADDYVSCQTSDENGKKICSSLGIKVNDNDYRIE